MNVQAILWNPIVAKEYRSRMRTMRSPLAMTGYVVAIGALGWAVYSGMAQDASLNGGGAGVYGRNLFVVLILFQMVLLAFITPALTSSAISGERERQTIDLLFVTRVPPFAILWGKLLASMSFVLLLLMVSVPIFSLVFLYGGIEPDQLEKAFLVTGVSALTLGAVGIMCSTLVRRTTMATVLAYGAAFLLLFGTLAWGLLFPNVVDPATNQKTPAPPAITYASPLIGLSWIAGPGAPLSWLDSMAGGQYGVRYKNSTIQPYPLYKVAAGAAQAVAIASSRGIPSTMIYNPVRPASSSTTIPSGPFTGWQYWQATILLEGVLAIVALGLSAVALPPIHRLPWRRKGAPAGATPQHVSA